MSPQAHTKSSLPALPNRLLSTRSRLPTRPVRTSLFHPPLSLLSSPHLLTHPFAVLNQISPHQKPTNPQNLPPIATSAPHPPATAATPTSTVPSCPVAAVAVVVEEAVEEARTVVVGSRGHGGTWMRFCALRYVLSSLLYTGELIEVLVG